MCGHDWCSVRISKEIVEFVSGQDENYKWDQSKVSAALTPEQQEILEKRGVLQPEEIHRLARKTRVKMETDSGAKAACHSDAANDTEANQLQIEALDVSAARPPLP
jgi:phosphomethylpyrimidine synthase